MEFNRIKKVWNWITGKEDVPPFTVPSAIITFSPEASEEGVEDSQNKIILEFGFDKIGNITQKVYPYSVARVFALEENKVPVFDKTQKPERFPIHVKSLPQEVQYLTR